MTGKKSLNIRIIKGEASMINEMGEGIRDIR
jgi:hypothetical protein